MLYINKLQKEFQLIHYSIEYYLLINYQKKGEILIIQNLPLNNPFFNYFKTLSFLSERN